MIRIDNKFEVGENVFYMHNNELWEGPINMITAEVFLSHSVIFYHTPHEKCIKSKIFKTKEELLESL